jgi:hypothetical protein
VPKRTFTSDTSAEEGRERVEFEFAGVGVITKKPWTESFTCVPAAPAGVLDDLAASVTLDSSGRMTWNQVSLLRFMRGVIRDEDVERLDALVHDKDRVVKIELLGETMLWVAEELAGRPMTP